VSLQIGIVGLPNVGKSTLFNALTNAGGALAPGHPLGVTNINGGYTQESDGTLDIELGGYTQGTEYDFVNVTGLASLDGSVDVSLINSFQPKLGDRFDVLLASNGIDDLGLDVNFGPPAGFSYSIVPWGGSAEMLELQYVPEPGAWVLLALGAVALAGWGYRRTKRSAR